MYIVVGIFDWARHIPNSLWAQATISERLALEKII